MTNKRNTQTQKDTNIISIDLSQWTTQADKARTWPRAGGTGTGVTVEYICKLIAQGKLKAWHIEPLNITLVER
jgi:hypothetical protein